MKLYFNIIIIIIPFYINAQTFDTPKIQPSQSFISGSFVTKPKTPETLPTMKSLYLNKVEIAKAKLTREENKLIKLARVTWQKEIIVRKEEEKLNKLENSLKLDNNPDIPKKIENCKKQIARSKNKLSKAKNKENLKSEKVKKLDLAIEASKFER